MEQIGRYYPTIVTVICLEYTNFGEKRNQLTYVYLVEYYLQEYARYEVVVVLYVAM
jgi:hypothetical protein